MNKARSPIRMQVWRTFAIAALLLGIITVFPLFAGSASAHHSNISARVVCDGTVTWTATSWSTGAEGTNPDIRVFMKIGSSGTPTQIGSGAFNAANGYQFTGTVAWPNGANSITISSMPYAKWGNDYDVMVGDSTTLSKPTSCPSAPAVEKALSCSATSPGIGSGIVTLTLTNAAGPFGPAVTFKVYNPDQTISYTSYTVNSMATRQVVFSNLNPDGDHYVKITVPGKDLTQHFSVDCDAPQPAVQQQAICVEGSGEVTFTLSNVGGEPVTFHVTNPFTSAVEDVVVAAGGSTTRTFSGFTDGNHTVVISALGQDFSQTFTTACDRPGVGSLTVVQECANYDGKVTVHLIATGGELPVNFVVMGTTYPVAPDTTFDVVLSGLTDGTHTIQVSAEGTDLSFDVTVGCDPEFGAVAVCNAVDVNQNVTGYWFAVTNTEANDLLVNWDSGFATVPAGGTVNISSASTPLSLKFGDVVVATAAASTETCSRDVVVTKELLGQPASAETYTIRIARLVGADYVEVTTFDLLAGGSHTVTLPSTLDPLGVTYQFQETVTGTAQTVSVSPETLTLTGHLGSSLSVTVTNGFAKVEIDKATTQSTVKPGETVTYTLQASNTGGLTLSPVVILDRLPARVEFVSAVVEGDAGTCVLSDANRPQLIVCTMDDPLAPAGVTALITVTVRVDNDAAAETLVNRAKVIGAYVPDAFEAGPLPTAMDCLSALKGTVCALSAEVTVTVDDSGQEAPTTTSSGQLPATGSESASMLLLGAWLAGAGVVVMVLRRRGAC